VCGSFPENIVRAALRGRPASSGGYAGLNRYKNCEAENTWKLKSN